MSAGTRAEVVARRRATVAFFATAALMNGAMAAVSPASTIFSSDHIGVAWSAVPQALIILGTGLGALLVARATTRFGWRSSLISAYAVAALGGVVGFVAVLTADIPLLCLGMLGLGLGAGGAIISRYAVAELYPVHRRGFAIGLVVASGSVGSVGGPLLLTPIAVLMDRVGLPQLSGPFLLAAGVIALAGIGLLTLPAHRRRPAEEGRRAPVLRHVFGSAAARMLLAVMLTGQLVMLAIMTAAPMDIHMKMGDLTMVGTALSAHIAGMFVLSPLIGWLVDRFGARSMMFSGLVTLILAAGLAAIASNQLLNVVALFLLGLGWNMCFMVGSRTLAVTLPARDQGQVVGAVDAIVWGVSATATVSGTALLSLGGYSTLSLIAGVLPVITVVFLIRSRPVAAISAVREPAAAPRPSGPGPERPDEARPDPGSDPRVAGSPDPRTS